MGSEDQKNQASPGGLHDPRHFQRNTSGDSEIAYEEAQLGELPKPKETEYKRELQGLNAHKIAPSGDAAGEAARQLEPVDIVDAVDAHHRAQALQAKSSCKRS